MTHRFFFFLFLPLFLSSCHSGYQSRDSFFNHPPFMKGGFTQRTVVPYKQKPLVIVDAGHGGEDFGTHSLSKPKYEEKYLTLSTSLILRDYLAQMGYQVEMTREEDIFISLDKRAEFANIRKPALFVSVHYNSAPSKQAEGVEVYYYKSDDDRARSNSSKIAADHVLKHVINNTQAKSRGVKHGNFAVIRETQMPAILIEGGFMTHEEEMSRIKNPSYLKQIAWGIAQGVNDFILRSRSSGG